MVELLLALVVSQAPAYAPGTGICPAGQYVTAVNKGRPPTCSVPASSGAPATAPYVTTAADAGLSAEVVLPTCGGTDKLTFNGTAISCAADVGGSASPGGSSGDLQTNNGAGGFAVYAGASCAAGTFPSLQSAAGAWTCAAPPAQDWSVITGKPATFPATLPVGTATALAANPANCTAGQTPLGVDASGAAEGCYVLSLGQLGNPTGDKTFTFPSGAKTLWEFSGSTDFAFSIHGTGAFTGTGDLVHLHMQGTTSAAGSDALHVEFEDADVTGLRIAGTGAASQSITTDGKITAGGLVTATGGFSGNLTGAVTGNASTATALAADPTDCGASQYATAISATGNLTCSTPSVSASAGGSNTQVQYNNATALGGMARVTTDGNDLIVTSQTSHPAFPAAGFMKAYAFQHHGSTAPGIMQFTDGEANMEQSIFPFTASFDYRWGCATPAGNGSTVITSTGFSTAATTGTAAAVTWASTDERTRHAWVQFPTTAAINLNAGVRANADQMWRGNAANLGGFYAWGTMNVVTANAGQRVFMGLKDSTAVLTTTADPNAALDTVYFGANAADTNLSICSNDGTSTATCTTLGANFPKATANVAYDWAFWAAPNASTINYYIRRQVGGQTASGSLSTDLPRNTQSLGWDMTINSGTSASITTMQFGGVCYVANP